ncbi:hypothetical protein LGH82_31775 [Mesorhizobium sp. PAMC28654]|uniref:hypothetical protein n=1 Tax=Mesorhizobium sp. PAMC28654 TaxID=2880934 RepID=UPI001D09F5CB|nr:hypothetical protein [Mesorhizobium sp. PAMC28654]UDL89579.1 hypothetical protein LGH82_31775 [Mesorhizobium sp. PAMC28654]
MLALAMERSFREACDPRNQLPKVLDFPGIAPVPVINPATPGISPRAGPVERGFI